MKLVALLLSGILLLTLPFAVSAQDESAPPALTPFDFNDFTDSADNGDSSPRGSADSENPEPPPEAIVPENVESSPRNYGEIEVTDPQSCGPECYGGTSLSEAERSDPPGQLPGVGTPLAALALASSMFSAAVFFVRRLSW